MTSIQDIQQRQIRIEKKLDELLDAVRYLAEKAEQEKPTIPTYVYGIKGIARLFGCSIATANRIKSSGVIDAAITQRNRRIIVDATKAMALFDDPEGRYGFRTNKKHHKK